MRLELKKEATSDDYAAAIDAIALIESGIGDLCDVVVDESLRRQGIGSILLRLGHQVRSALSILLRTGGQDNSGNALTVALRRQKLIEQRDASALSKGKASVIGSTEHQQIFLHLSKGAAEIGGAGTVMGGQLLEKLRHTHIIVGMGPVIAHSFCKLLTGKFDLLIGIDLIDTDHIAALAATGRPKAQRARTEIGVNLLTGNPQRRGNTLTKMPNALRIVPMEIPAHRYLPRSIHSP